MRSKLFLIVICSAIAIMLTACGGGGGEILPPGDAVPVADAGGDRIVATGDPVALDGSASTVGEGATLTYLWNIDSGPALNTAVLNDTSAVNPTFTPDMDGEYVISLIVNDSVADSAVDTVTITASSTPPATDTLVLNIDSAGATTYTETADAGSPNGFDPMISGAYDTGNSATTILLFSGYGAGVWDEQLSLEFTGNATGLYTLSDGSAVLYAPSGFLNIYAPDNGDYTSVSIYISQYDVVGGRIKGTYNCTLCLLLSGDCSVPSNRKTFVGSFDVKREADM